MAKSNLAVVEMPAEAKKKSDDEIRKERAARKANIAKDSRSIFWMPFSGKGGYSLFNYIMSIEMEMNYKRRFLGEEIQVPDYQDMIKKIEKTAEEVWAIVTEVIPQLHSVKIDNFQRLNIDESKKLALAKIGRSRAILSQSKEVSYLAMAIREIETEGQDLKNTGNYVELTTFQEKLLPAYSKIQDKLKELEDAVKSLGPKRPPKPGRK